MSNDPPEDGDNPTGEDPAGVGDSRGTDEGERPVNSGTDPRPGVAGEGDPDDNSGEPRESITEGSLVRPLFALAWPIVVIQLLQVSYNIADTLYLGRLSSDAVGALSLAFPLIFLLVAVAGGFTTAGAILVAQYTGAEGDQSAGTVVGQTFTSVGVLSVAIGAVGFLYTGPALDLLSEADGDILTVVDAVSSLGGVRVPTERIDVCDESPATVTLNDGHRVACHLHDDTVEED